MLVFETPDSDHWSSGRFVATQVAENSSERGAVAFVPQYRLGYRGLG